MRLFVVFFGFAVLSAQPSDLEREVRAFSDAVRAATATRDRAAIERLYDPSFTALLPTGLIQNRDGWISDIQRGTLAAQRFADQEQLDERLTLHGSTGATHTVITRYTDPVIKRDVALATRTVYARIDGEWRVISNQGSALHNGPLVTANHSGIPGTYRIDGNRTLTIVKTGRTLFAKVPALGADTPLFDLPEDEFVAPGDFRYKFTRDASGRATGVTMSRFGKPAWSATRVE